MDSLINHPVIITVFTIVIIAMLLLDLGVLNKKSHVISNREAAFWSILWISLAMGFSGILYVYMGFEKFAQFQLLIFQQLTLVDIHFLEHQTLVVSDEIEIQNPYFHF